jgi:RNA polymerase sigma-70 factor (ECF subfamily)
VRREFANGRPRFFDHNPEVLKLNPTLAEMETLDTQSLLDQSRGGDAEAFCELCRTVETRLLRQAIALCGDVSLAEDLAQDTLVEAWKCLRRYNGRCQFFTWLCAILLNRHRHSLRKRRRWFFPAFARLDQEADVDSIEQFTDDDARPDEAAELREQAALVRKCVQALPRKHQQVIYLRFYVDDSLEGVAAALGCSVGTVKSRLFNALDKLRGMNALNAQFAELKTKGRTL